MTLVWMSPLPWNREAAGPVHYGKRDGRARKAICGDVGTTTTNPKAVQCRQCRIRMKGRPLRSAVDHAAECRRLGHEPDPDQADVCGRCGERWRFPPPRIVQGGLCSGK